LKRFILILCMILLVGKTSYADTLPPEQIIGEAGIIIDYKTGQVLWEKNPHQKMYPASTTKILTAIIILENHQLDEVVQAADPFVNPGGGHMATEHGEVFTLEQLMYGLLVLSANDAAQTLAEYHSGSVEAFAEEMNKKAIEIGAIDSNFVNPHGLHNANHYTTAYDMALIAQYAFANADFREIVNTDQYLIPITNKKNQARDYIKNTNLFVRDTGAKMTYKGQLIPVAYDRVDGIKTGYTDEASYCLVSTAIEDDNRYIVVVLRSPGSLNIYKDSRSLIDYAFDNFITHRFISEGSFVDTHQLKGGKQLRINLVAEKSLAMSLDRSIDLNQITENILIQEDITTPLTAGTVVGQITYSYNNKVLGMVNLVSQYDVDESNLVTSVETALIKRDENNNIDMKYYIGVLLKLLLAFIIYRSIMTYWLIRQKKKKIQQENCHSDENIS